MKRRDFIKGLSAACLGTAQLETLTGENIRGATSGYASNPNAPSETPHEFEVINEFEAMEDIRKWGYDQLDDVTRRQIYVSF